MDKKKKIAIIIASVIGALAVIAGVCVAVWFATREHIAAAQNKYEKDYQSFCTYEHAAEIEIDGVLDEACWQNKKWYNNTFLENTEGSMPTLKVTSYVDEYGIYLAAFAEDSNIVNDGQRNPNINTNFEFYITAYDVDEEQVDDTIITQTYNIEMLGDVSNYYPNVDRAVVVNGEINSGETESATLEMFIPWENLGVDKSKGIPESFYCLPGYMAVLPGQTAATVMKPVWYPYKYAGDCYIFDADGYTNVDREGAVVGDNIFGNSKTANWDISQEADGIIRSSTGTENHKIFFKEEYGSDFIVEATIIPVKDLKNTAPKAGIYFQSTNGVYNAVFLDMRETYLTDGINGTRNFSKLRIAALDNNENSWNMQYLDSLMYENPNVGSKEGVTMTVIKYGAQYWVFLDGKFVTTLDYYFMDNDVIPGFFSLGGDVIYKNYSCTEINEDSLIGYINNKNLYYIESKVGSAGGEVTTSEFSVEKGGSYDIEIVSNSGYVVSSVLVNGEEKIADVKKNATGGVYTVNNVTSNQEIKVSFEKADCFNVTGQVKSGDTYLISTVTLEGLTNKSLCYKASSAGEKGFSVKVPAGKYQVTVTTDGYQKVVSTITVNGDMSKTFTTSPSKFAASVEVNGKTVNSKMSVWQLEEHLGKVTTSYEAGGKTAPLYFDTTAKDFVVETTIDYTTAFQSGVEYQPDLMGGFIFHDGNKSGYLAAVKNGIRYTGWTNVYNLLDHSILMYPDKQTVTLAVAKKGTAVSVYLNGRLVKNLEWSDIMPEAKADSEFAIGFYMVADKTADIQFSNYSLKSGASAVDKYIATHVTTAEAVEGSAIFAKNLAVNDVQLISSLSNWDLSEVASGTVKGSYALGTKAKPLYFSEHGNNILVEAEISYTTAFTAGGDYQPDLMGGFYLSDGTNKGYVVANKTGVVFTGFNKEQELVDDAVLTYNAASGEAPRSVKMTMAVSGGYVYVYFDDACVWKQKLNVVVENVNINTDLAVGLYVITDKTSDIKFSNTSISTDANTVTNYIKTHK